MPRDLASKALSVCRLEQSRGVGAIDFFRGGETALHPAVAVFLLLGVGLTLLGSRQLALLPVLAATSFVPIQQRIVIGGLDFDIPRLLVSAALLRVLFRGEFHSTRLHKLDMWVVVWQLLGYAMYLVRLPTIVALTYNLGLLVDCLGTFFACRLLIRGPRDVEFCLAAFCWIAAAVAPAMIVEGITGFNVFSVLGGVSEQSWVRDGSVRAQGAFAHPIIAGSFGASLLPLAIALMLANGRSRTIGAIGILGATTIAITPSSSGPVLALLAAIVGWMLFPARRFIRMMRWAFAATLVVLHFAREMPVWHLIGRASDLLGGTGYHRYRLIDAFIANWRDWFLIGTTSTASWGWGLFDTTNQFVVEGTNGGALTLAAFVMVLVYSFRASGSIARLGRKARGVSKFDRSRLEQLGWGFGVTLAVHCVSWISVSYFGQMRIVLFIHLALLSGLAGASLRVSAMRGDWVKTREVPV
jgi:hypothetical protein